VKLAQCIASDSCYRFVAALHPLVQRAHGGVAQHTAQPREHRHRPRVFLRKPGADQRRRLVGWEEVPIIAQHHQLVARDETVGGIAVHHVHPARRERAVFERLIERPHRFEAEPVGARQTGEAIGALDEVGREPGRESRRHPREIAQRGEAVAPRGLRSHRYRVTVLEAQWRKPAKPVTRAELPLHFGEDAPRVAAWLLVENGQQPGARVLRVDIDRARTQRIEGDGGGAEAGSPLHLDPLGLEKLREHLGQQIRFAEGFRRYYDRARRFPRRRRTGLANSGTDRRQRSRREEQRNGAAESHERSSSALARSCAT
jgi:hypothetical protein